MSQFPYSISNNDGFLNPKNEVDKYPALDISANDPINLSLESNVEDQLQASFLESNLFDINKTDKLIQKDYMYSEKRIENYKNLLNKDLEFNKFIKNTYGSVENYLQLNESLTRTRLYDPNTDFLAEVDIITEDVYYKTGFISLFETNFELMSGVCTVEYVQTDGRADRIVGTLSENIVPISQRLTRLQAFGGLRGSRVLFWDIVKQKWASFYMGNLKRFVRDENSGIQ
jgi:hypothetical protein